MKNLLLKNLKCLHCGNEFEGTIEKDKLGWHSSCPVCKQSFDLDYSDTAKRFDAISAIAFGNLALARTILEEDTVEEDWKGKWKNYGDIDFISYGGCLIKKIEEGEYDVLQVYAPCDLGEDITEGKEIYLAMLHRSVEPLDFEDKKLEILSLIGEEDKADLPMFEIMDGASWAKEIVEAGEHDIWYNYQGHCYDYENRVELKNLLVWLKQLEIPVELLGADKEIEDMYNKINNEEEGKEEMKKLNKEKYEVVMNCFDYNVKVPMYTDKIALAFNTESEAYDAMEKACQDECETLNRNREINVFRYSQLGDKYDLAVLFWDGEDYRVVTGYNVKKFN